MYATPADLLTRIGAEELAQRADRSVPRLVPSALIEEAVAGSDISEWQPDEQAAVTAALAIIERALEDAAQTIDGYLAARYPLPLTPVPPVIVRLCCDMARYFLYDDVVTELVEKRYLAAISYLKDVASAKVSFGAADAADDGIASTPVAAAVKVRSSPRRFGDDVLDRY